MEDFLKENNIEFENNKIKIKNTTKSVKIDIGLSWNAPHSIYWLERQKDLEVFGFEPVSENIKSVKNRITNKNFHLIPCALSNNKEKKDINFYVTKNDMGCSSLFQPKVIPVKKVIKVPVFSLKHFFDLFPWDKMPIIEYIKIDAQGSDLYILKGAEDYLQKRVVYITAEPDGYQYKGAEETNVSAITNYMKTIGFDYINHKDTMDPTFLNKNFIDKKSVQIYQKG